MTENGGFDHKDTYRGETQVKETISSREERFEFWRNSVGLFLGPAVAIFLYLIPIPELSPTAHNLAAIIGLVCVWWITEPIPIPMTAMLGAVLCVTFGIADVRKVFAPFADPIIQLFMGSFILAEALAVHKLDKRFAYAIMSMRILGNNTGRILLAFGIITGFLSMWISNTAATAMMFPIAVGIVHAMSDIMARQTGRNVDARKLRFGTAMMLMAAYSASAGGIGTPVGSPPNLIGIALIEKFCQVRIPFFQWMGFAVPLLIVQFLILFVLMYYLNKPEMTKIEGCREYVDQELQSLGGWTRGQKNALFAFLVTVTLWIIPGILAIIYGATSSEAFAFSKYFPEGVSALIGATLLFLVPVDWKNREFTLTWKQATNIDWGTLLLFGGGITLGNLMFETQLAEAVGKGLLSLSGATSMWGITFGSIFIAILVSETSSNTASANMVVPVMISLAMAAGVNPVPPAIGATLGASWGFMLPVSTPPNAIVYGSGMVPITKMVRAGIFFDIIGGIGLWVGLWLLLPLFGLA